MRGVLIPALLLVGCAAVPAQPVPLAGEWAGPHIVLHLTAAGGTVEYDCAHGTIAPVIPGPDGSFTAQGTHTREHGGPVRQGQVLPSWPTRYDGRVAGDRMTIRGITSNGFTLGPFELRRGAASALARCL